MNIKEAKRQLSVMAEKSARNGYEVMGNNNSNSPVMDVIELLKTRDKLIEETIGLSCAVEKAILPIADVIFRIRHYQQLVSFLVDVKKDFYNVSLKQSIKPQLSMADIEDMIDQTEEKIISLQTVLDNFEIENEVEGLISTEES